MLKTTLEEVYEGVTKQVEITRSRICTECSGTGSKNKVNPSCYDCQGRGVRFVISQTAFGLIKQQVICNGCQGEGVVINQNDKCQKCNFEKVCQEKKTLTVTIEKGAPDGRRYTFFGEGNQEPNFEAGDVHIELFLEKHPKFIRKGADLAISLQITIIEALTQFEIALKHLDGREIYIRNNPNEIIQPGAVKTVKEAGMPFHGSPLYYGNLYISFDINIPKINTEQKIALMKFFSNEIDLLKKRFEVDTTLDVEKVKLLDFNPNEQNTDERGGRKKEKIQNEDDYDDVYGYPNGYMHNTSNTGRYRCANQ